MPFKTLEEANEFEVTANNQIATLKTQVEGAKTKITEMEGIVENNTKEINRLKIKNYELFEQVATTKDSIKPNTQPQTQTQTQENKVTLNDIIKDL